MGINFERNQGSLTLEPCVVDPDPDTDWIWIQWDSWILIRICHQNPGGQKLPTKIEKKVLNSIFSMLDVLFRGLTGFT
jgi:hypothetical protein